jgi:outer membrane receptor protein involved in Fe transport
MKSKHILMLLLSVIAIWAAHAVYAQVNTATVSGTVMDSTGAAIPSATLNLQSIQTGVVRTAKSDSEGRFAFTFVPIGAYTLKTSHPGFENMTRTDIQLAADQLLSLPITMSLENVHATVTVSAEEAVLQTSSSEQQSSIPETKLNELPVAHQNWVNLMALDPSVSTQGVSQGMTINGLPPEGLNVTVDGTNATSNPEFNSYNMYGGPNVINTVGNDAIAEISVVKGIVPAIIGGTLSGNINIITKSGSNQFHGSLYEINEVSLYDARNQFLTYRPRTTFNQYGGSAGGPIRHEKYFFFTNYEGAQVSSLKAISGTVPSPYLKSISPSVYAPLLALYPSIAQPSNATALVGVYSGTASQIQKDGSGLIRIDSYLNSSDQLAVRFIRARPQISIPSLIPTSPQTYSGHTEAVNANYLHLGNNWTSNLRFGFNQIKLTRINQGMKNKVDSVAFAGFGSASITGNLYKGFYQQGNYTTYEETAALVRGKQTFQFGGIVQRQNASRYMLQLAGLTYSSLPDFLANVPSTAILELYTLPSGVPPFGFINYQYGIYLQDDIHLSNKLTLNLGMRYDYFTVPHEYHGRFYNRGVDPSHPELGAGFGDYLPADSIYNADHGGVQPRIGIAWQLSRRTVVHAGFGVLTLGHNFFSGPVNLTQVSATLPFSFALSKSQVATAGLKFPIDSTTYPSEVATLQSSGVLSSKLANTTTVPAYNPNPYTLQRFLGIQQQLPWRMNATVDYVGSAGVQLSTFETKNLPDRSTGISPVPSFGQFTQNGVGDHSNNNSLQANMTKSTSHGLTFGAAYAWSNTLAYSDVDIIQPSQPQTPDNFKAEYGPATFDVKHRVKLQGVWEPSLDFIVHNNKVTKLLVSNWQFAAIYTAQTGLPANIVNSSSSYPNDRPDSTYGVSPYLSGYRAFPGSHQYLNSSAFTTVSINSASGAQARAGTLRRNAVRLPGTENLDAGISKNIAITEKTKFVLRMDAFNVFNHTNLGGLQTSISSSTFGRLTSATPRTMQIGGRITF